ncbi:MAG: galactose mutarotase [Chloroflexales bacterium]|nr:galactose mutarotase [Chloroflexales bacterium]
MSIKRETVGAGRVYAERYTLANASGLEVRILTYGGTLCSLRVPGRDGQPAEVLLGFDDFGPYLGPHPYFGSLIGRYANRIRAGRFSLGDQVFSLATNSGPNHLHGGPAGFHQAIWKAQALAAPDGPSLTLAHSSPDGEGGYPGTLSVVVTYTLTDQNDLRIDYQARTDRETVLNLTSHAYFNLAGGGNILGHRLQLAASRFLPTDATSIPLGELRPVAGTPFDFRRPALIGARIDDDDAQLRGNQGYDHTYVLDKAPGQLAFAARVTDPGSGRVMELYTTEPGVQLYTGNFLDASFACRGGRPCERYGALCLEAQHFPDSPNQPGFPSTVLRPGERYTQTTVYRFRVEE